MRQWIWNVVHNCIVHPVMPFTFERLGVMLDELHDTTARFAFGGDDANP